MNLAFWRKKDMSSFIEIAKKMDNLQTKITEKDAETKLLADGAVKAHQERQLLEAELVQTQTSLTEALGAITGFLSALTKLPSLVIEADAAFDAETAPALNQVEPGALPNPIPATPVVSDPAVLEAPPAPPVVGDLGIVGGGLGLPGEDTATQPAPVAEQPVAEVPVEEVDPTVAPTDAGPSPVVTPPAPAPTPAPAPAPETEVVGTEESAPFDSPEPAPTAQVQPAPGTDVAAETTPVPVAPAPAPVLEDPATETSSDGDLLGGQAEPEAEAPSAPDPLDMPPPQV